MVANDMPLASNDHRAKVNGIDAMRHAATALLCPYLAARTEGFATRRTCFRAGFSLEGDRGKGEESKVAPRGLPTVTTAWSAPSAAAPSPAPLHPSSVCASNSAMNPFFGCSSPPLGEKKGPSTSFFG